MRRLYAVLLAAAFGVVGTAGPALACHDRYSHGRYSDRHGYWDDDCDSDGYYCDGYGWYRSDRDDYRYHRRYYRDGPRCVFHEEVGAVTFDVLCHY